MAILDRTFTYRKVGDWAWLRGHIPLFWSLSRTHLYLALAAVLLGFLVALPLGSLAVRAPKTYAAVLSLTTVLYAVPSLAVFAFLVGVTGLTEYSRRDRRAVVGTWLGREYWGTGVNRESKALIAHLGFEVIGLERLGAYADL